MCGSHVVGRSPFSALRHILLWPSVCIKLVGVCGVEAWFVGFCISVVDGAVALGWLPKDVSGGYYGTDTHEWVGLLRAPLGGVGAGPLEADYIYIHACMMIQERRGGWMWMDEW
jgi:hypothetical protein